MVVSVHLADVGPRGVRGMLATKLEPAQTDGLLYRERALAVPLDSGPRRVPRLGRVGLITAWEDDAAALVLPPRLVATFSLWRGATAMRAYAEGVSGEHHRDAMRANAAEPFHHETAFIRFAPHAPTGLWWDGRDPFAGLTLRAAAATA
ncbi:MAG: hypothetical protein ACYCU0_06525 [Solirubrobacteraceae bacterium]